MALATAGFYYLWCSSFSTGSCPEGGSISKMTFFIKKPFTEATSSLAKNLYLSSPTKLFVMPTQPHKPSTFLLFPWGLLSIVIILILNLTIRDVWLSKNFTWIALVLIIPAAILENFKVGYSTMRIMFLKLVFSLLSFLLVGMAFGSALTHYYNVKFVKEGATIQAIILPWYVLLALVVLLLIQVAQLFSMLKAVKREFMQMDPDQ
jgi:hypothetical protein